MKTDSKPVYVGESVAGSRVGLFFLFNVLLMVWSYRHLLHLWQYSDQHVHYTHFVLIAPVAAYFFWTERERIFAQTQWSWTGLAVIFLGAVLWVGSPGEVGALSESGILAWRTFALWLIWAGGFLACFGLPAVKSGMFPLGFLLLAIPFPESVLNSVVSILQHSTAEVVAVIFHLLPTPVLREGTTFHLPNLSIEVAPECSGIRSSIALCITALIGGFMFLRSPGKRLILILTAVPIAIFKNGLRIVTLTLLALYWDPAFLQGALHTRGGYPFFVLSLLMLIPVLFLLRRRERLDRLYGL